MDQSDPKGAFGETLARYYHQSESKTAVTSWPEQSTFAVTRLHSEVGLPDVSQPIPAEAAIHVSIAIKPVPLQSYELYIDDRRIEVPFIPPYRTSIMDLESHPICTVDCGFDCVHYHVPREGLDEIARDHKIKPVGIEMKHSNMKTKEMQFTGVATRLQREPIYGPHWSGGFFFVDLIFSRY